MVAAPVSPHCYPQEIIAEFKRKQAARPPVPADAKRLTDEDLKALGAEKMADIDGVVFGLGGGAKK